MSIIINKYNPSNIQKQVNIGNYYTIFHLTPFDIGFTSLPDQQQSRV